MINQTTIQEFYDVLLQECPEVNLDIAKSEEVLRNLISYYNELAKIAKANDWSKEEVNKEKAPP